METLQISKKIERMERICKELSRIGESVKEHKIEWKAIETSAMIRAYTMEHLLASRDVKKGDKWNTDLLRKLDKTCVDLLEKIKADWDRNRYADDPNKNDIYLSRQNILYSFAQMHNFHQSILIGKP